MVLSDDLSRATKRAARDGSFLFSGSGVGDCERALQMLLLPSTKQADWF